MQARKYSVSLTARTLEGTCFVKTDVYAQCPSDAVIVAMQKAKLQEMIKAAGVMVWDIDRVEEKKRGTYT